METTFLWGNHQDEELRATLVKLPAGYKGEIKNLSDNFRAVVITGTIAHQVKDSKYINLLEAGSYFGAKKDATHTINVKDDEEAVIYMRTNGEFEVTKTE